MEVDTTTDLMDLSPEKIQIVRRILFEKNVPRYSRMDRVEVFVGNIPYHYSEKEICDLFAEYGITNISLVRDENQKSKGFAFIEFALKEDAERAVEEMHLFYADAGRKLTVRMVSTAAMQ